MMWLQFNAHITHEMWIEETGRKSSFMPRIELIIYSDIYYEVVGSLLHHGGLYSREELFVANYCVSFGKPAHNSEIVIV